MALDLPGLAGELAAARPAPAAAPARVRGISARAARGAAEKPPPRKSLRSQGLAPDGTLAKGIDYERRDGSIVLADKAGALSWCGFTRSAAARRTAPPPAPRPVSPNGACGSQAPQARLAPARPPPGGRPRESRDAPPTRGPPLNLPVATHPPAGSRSSLSSPRGSPRALSRSSPSMARRSPTPRSSSSSEPRRRPPSVSPGLRPAAPCHVTAAGPCGSGPGCLLSSTALTPSSHLAQRAMPRPQPRRRGRARARGRRRRLRAPLRRPRRLAPAPRSRS